MKKISILLISIVLGFIVAGPTTVWAGQSAKVIRLALPFPPMDPVAKDAMSFAERFNQRAGGKYVIEVHPGSSLIQIFESLDAVRTGMVEMALWPTGIFASADRRFAASELPFLTNNVEADAVVQSKLMQLYNEFMEKKFSAKVVYTHTLPGINLLSKSPIKTLGDWKGLMTQSISPQSAKIVKALGGAPVPMPFTEGYQALQKGVVNAAINGTSGFVQFKMFEVADYMTRAFLMSSGVLLAVNLEQFNQMPEDIQQILIETGLEQQRISNAFWIKANEMMVSKLQEFGVTVYNVPQAERDKWKAQLKPDLDKILKSMGSDFSQKLLKIIDQANRDYPYAF